MFLNGRWVTGTGDDDEYVKKSISSDGLYSPEESGGRGSGCLAADFEAARTSLKIEC